LIDLSQNFSILSDLKHYKNTFSSSTNDFEMQSQKTSQKKAVKNTFFPIAKCVFFHFDSSFQTS
jgi:hypothetical protein